MAALALPIMLANVGTSLSGIADVAVMGRMASPDYLSATAIGAALFSTLYWAFAFLRMGTGGLVAQAFGADDPETMRRTTVRALALAALAGALVVVLREPLLGLGLRAMGGGPELMALTGDYFRVRVLAAPATLALFAIQGALIGRQAMGTVLALQLLQNGLNVALNVALFTATDLAIVGVAAATAIADVVTLVVGLALLRPVLVGPPAPADRPDEPLLRWLLEREALHRLLSVSGNLFVRSLCLTAAYYWLTAAGTRLGVAVLAANAILLQLVGFMSHALDGFAQAAETLTGAALGRRDPAALRRAVRTSVELALGTAGLFCVAYLLLGGAFIDAMTTQPEIRAAARTWLPWVALAPLVGVWSFMLDGVFIGTTHTREMRDGMLVSLGAFVAATFALVPWLGNHGLWLSWYVLLVVRAATLGARYPRVLAAAEPTR